MNFSELLHIYRSNKRIQSIPEQWHSGQESCVHLQGISGSLISFIAAATFKQGGFNHVFVFPDKDSAAYFHNDLTAILDKKDKVVGVVTPSSILNLLEDY